MTIDEFRILIQGIETNLLAIKNGAESGLSMTAQVLQMTSPQNPASVVLNQLPDPAGSILNAFMPDYLSMLTSIEAAADLLGTDLLN